MTRPGADGTHQRRVLALFRTGFWVPLMACTYLALVPEPPEHPVFRLSDVLLHGLAFAYLSLALMLAYPGGAASRHDPRLRTFVLMLGYGLFLELVQALVPERSAELKDLLVDVAGILTGLVLARYLGGPLRALAGWLSARF